MSYIFKHLEKGSTQGSGSYVFRKYAEASPTPQIESFLTFSSPGSFTLSVANMTKNWDGTLETSTDKTNWTIWDGTSAVSSSNDGKLYVRGTGNTVITGNVTDPQWTFTGSNISISGNIENLLDYATVELGNHPAIATYCFRRWMYQSQAITDCSNLVLGATTLVDYCYATMFSGCSSLTAAPALPVTTLASNCYNSMLRDCISLTTPPALPATILASYCYAGMFYGCTNLTSIPALPALNINVPSCYQNMFYICSRIKLSTTQVDDYINEYRIPISGTGSVAGTNSLTYMFTSTGGTFTGTPSINTTYYTSNAIVNTDGTITPAVS